MNAAENEQRPAMTRKKDLGIPFFPRRSPRLGTQAARDFFLSFEQINRFGSFVLGMVAHIDHVARLADHALKLAGEKVEAHEDGERSSEERTRTLHELASHRPFFCETILCRHVENYLNYLSGLLYEVFVQRPESMKSSEKVDIEFVLQHGSIESLYRGLAERKVENLSYASFEALHQFFTEHFKLEICSQQDLNHVKESIEVRNLSVHNRCRINKRFVERTGRGQDVLGEALVVGVSNLDVLLPALHRNVKRVDADARRRLRLRGVRFSVPDFLREEWDKEQ
jgi:hypothetical protein